METPDLDELSKQYSGGKFGELVLSHCKQLDMLTCAAAMLGMTNDELPEEANPLVLVEEWLEHAEAVGVYPEFWAIDCGEAVTNLKDAAAAMLRQAGVEPTPALLYTMFQLVVVNATYQCHKDPEFKTFVQKSIGMGFLGRLFG